MSAVKLREAAALMHKDADKRWHAVGDWLSTEAELFERLVSPVPELNGALYCGRCDEGFVGSGQCWCWPHTFDVARAYLGRVA